MKSNFYISFGIWLIILPLLGIPGDWKNILVILSGIFLMLVSLGPTILKKLQPKPKKKQDKINSQDSSAPNNKFRFSATENNQAETEIEAEKEI